MPSPPRKGSEVIEEGTYQEEDSSPESPRSRDGTLPISREDSSGLARDVSGRVNTSGDGIEVVVNGSKVTPTTPLSIEARTVHKSEAVRLLVSRIVSMKQFSFVALKKKTKELFKEHLLNVNQHSACLDKRDSLSISSMWNGDLCQSGENELDEGSHKFQVKTMDTFHLEACPKCSVSQAIRPDCYWPQLRRCITHGWNPPVVRPIETQYHTRGNNRLSAKFSKSFEKGVAAFVADGVLVSCEDSQVRPDNLVINPMGMVLRKSDMARAKLLTGIDIVDQESLTRANMELEGQKMLEVKCRVSTNASAKGINAAMLIPPFSYATVQSAVEIIKKDDWLGKGDVEKYFLNFPFAVEARWMFGVCVLSLVYFFAKVFFGLGSAPYYTSVWGAEFRSWALHKNINCVHMVDDWLVAEPTEVQARKSMSGIVSMLVDIGLAMAEHKFDFGQQLTFLGVKLDTVTMRMSFDSLQCQVMVVLLTGHLDSLERCQRIPYTEAVHVCGKLNWLAEVLQAGRVHTSSWWKYLPFAEKNLPVDLRRLIIHDTKWWIGVISKWVDNDLSGWEFPIMSASELLDDPNRMQVVGSDAAGDDGIGFYHGSRNCDDPQFYAFQWPDGFVMISSMWGELKALQAYLLVVKPEDKVVV